jgi:hypothetical protein
MYPLSVEISTRDSVQQKEIRRQYVVQTRHPRWEILKIFVHAFIHLRFR